MIGNLRNYIKEQIIKRVSEDKRGIVYGVVVAGIITIAIVGSYLLLALIFSMPARASEWPFPEPPSVTVGFDLEMSETYCNNSEYIGDSSFYRDYGGSLVGSFRVEQLVWKNRQWEAAMGYRHQSCAFQKDLEQYDAVGISFTWQPWK